MQVPLRRLRAAIVGLALGLPACGTVAPVIVEAPPAPLGGSPALFVMAERDRRNAERSLREAGFEVSGQPREAEYGLRVEVGARKRTSDCGTLHNVRYAVYDRGLTLVEIKGRGWIGACRPNIFDQMSAALRSQFESFRSPAERAGE